jgi:hypothetical protein
MSPVIEIADLAKRYIICPDGYVYTSGACRPESAWYWWGRWVLTAVIIVVFLIILLSLGCLNSRRRRRQGLAPVYGTGWMAPAPKYDGYQNNANTYGPPPYTQNAQYQQYPPAPVQNQYTGSTFTPSNGFYGGHDGPQPPQNTYQRGVGGDAYEAPAGPPPGKTA